MTKRLILDSILVGLGIMIGYTQIEPEVVPKIEYRSIDIQKGDSFMAEITAYTAGFESCGKLPSHPAYGKTASGEKVRKGIIAADTRVLPMHSKVYIEGLGIFEVKDTGGAIQGNRIDIYMDNLDEAINFGRQHRQLIVLDKG